VNEPKRLVDEAPDGFEASLIRAARKDAPSVAVRRAAAAAGGAAVATLLARNASGTGTTLKAILGAGAKGFLVGAVVTSTAVGASSLLAPRHAAPAATARVSGERTPAVVVQPPASSPPEATADAPATPSVGTGTVGRVVLEHSVPPARQEPPSSTRDTATGAVGASSALGEELRAFEPAEQAFAAGEIAAAARELDAYRRRFPNGALSLEAQVLHLEILSARGDRAAARAGAQAFLAANPSAPASRRVRSLLARLEATRP
jgi:hypothetical protein